MYRGMCKLLKSYPGHGQGSTLMAVKAAKLCGNHFDLLHMFKYFACCEQRMVHILRHLSTTYLINIIIKLDI